MDIVDCLWTVVTVDFLWTVVTVGTVDCLLTVVTMVCDNCGLSLLWRVRVDIHI